MGGAATTARTGRRPRRRSSRLVVEEEAAGLVSMVFGVAVFLAFLLLATQTLLHLYATSTIGAAAFDGARRASASGSGCLEGEDTARDLLGRFGTRPGVSVECGRDGDDMVVRIVAPSPARLTIFPGAFEFGVIEREARFRAEEFG